MQLLGTLLITNFQGICELSNIAESGTKDNERLLDNAELLPLELLKLDMEDFKAYSDASLEQFEPLVNSALDAPGC